MQAEHTPTDTVLIRGGNYRVTHDSIHNTWPTITIISGYSNSSMTDISLDNQIVIQNYICLTEKYKIYIHKKMCLSHQSLD